MAKQDQSNRNGPHGEAEHGAESIQVTLNFLFDSWQTLARCYMDVHSSRNGQNTSRRCCIYRQRKYHHNSQHNGEATQKVETECYQRFQPTVTREEKIIRQLLCQFMVDRAPYHGIRH